MTVSIKSLDRPELLEIHLQGTFDKDDVRHFDQLLTSKVTGEKLRLLVRLEDFEGWETLTATWENLRLMQHHRDDVERIAAVADRAWKGAAVKFVGSFNQAETRVFHSDEVAEARSWLHATDV